MNTPFFAPRVWSSRDVFLMAILLFLSGVGMVFRSASEFAERNFGISGAALALAFFAYCVAVSFLARWLFLRGACGSARRLMAVTVVFVSLVIVLMVSIWVPGSTDHQADRDDALEIAGTRLLHGLDPWNATTQLGSGQLISPLMGGVILALPFVFAFGSSAIQSVFWSSIGAYGALRQLGLMRTALIAFALISSPIFLNEILFQSDLWVNALVISIAALWGYRRLNGSTARLDWGYFASAILLGLALADRYIFLPLIIPIGFLLLKRQVSRPRALWLLLALGVTGILIIVPWFIYPASLKSTLWNFTKAASDSVPHSGLILVTLMLLVATLGSFYIRSLAGAFGVMAATMFCVPLWQSIASSLESQSLSFNGYTSVAYSVAFLIFGLLALVLPKQELWAGNSKTEGYFAT